MSGDDDDDDDDDDDGSDAGKRLNIFLRLSMHFSGILIIIYVLYQNTSTSPNTALGIRLPRDQKFGMFNLPIIPA